MSTLSEFLHMGGYAFYVWTSYGLAALVLVAIWISPWRRERRILKDLGEQALRAKAPGPAHRITR